MVLINQTAKELTAKIVYYGPGLCGKTTNLIRIYENLPEAQKGKMLCLSTKQDRTLFFDLLPVEAGKIRGQKIRFQLYAVPGQVFYNETRKMVLRNSDGIVFVVDSQKAVLESNRESFANLMENLRYNGIEPRSIPLLVQFNKLDLPDVLPVDILRRELGLEKYPHMEASALLGQGVVDTYRRIAKLILKKLRGKEDDVVGTLLHEVRAMTMEDTHPPGRPLGPIPMPDLPANYDRLEEVNLENLIEEHIRAAASNAPSRASSGEEEVEELPMEALMEEPPRPTQTMKDTKSRIHKPADPEAEAAAAAAPDLQSLRESLEKIRDLLGDVLAKLP